MSLLSIILDIAGLIGVLFGARCYLELYRWARQCQGARIVVTAKRKVQLGAPIVQWLEWCNMLEGDEKANGRVVYRNGAFTVAILRKPGAGHRTRLLATVRRVRNARRQGAQSTAKAPVRKVA